MNRKGFTMLEMLIVLSVISLIFTLTIPNIQKRLETIREKGCESLIEVVNANIIQYELDHGEVPQSIEDLVSEGYLTQKQTTCMDGSAIEIVDGQASK
ncbi:MAG: prepilin-type N-terminal cleavage/methylation domain-containing protein [Erysipelotrichales bacterium]|nr:prepilin-type N-terminal cleavage/methylation domain-containing protein [Erysipelotrichales bacterium]MBR3694229.1 prepilin-type N-terminal cleavage/methylation domain-containing protein [Erysipelotrichales bacterium]